MSGVDNPPVFPVADVRDSDGCGIVEGSPGMSLLDWFAGQALSGLLADGGQRAMNKALKQETAFLDLGPVARMEVLNSEIAAGCYEIAHAMLATRLSVQGEGCLK